MRVSAEGNSTIVLTDCPKRLDCFFFFFFFISPHFLDSPAEKPLRTFQRCVSTIDLLRSSLSEGAGYCATNWDCFMPLSFVEVLATALNKQNVVYTCMLEGGVGWRSRIHNVVSSISRLLPVGFRNVLEFRDEIRHQQWEFETYLFY